jgi:adenylate cyclase
MEIERKFLAGDPPGLDSAPAERIEQGYLAADPDDGGEVRLRRKGDRLLLTAKRGSGLAREEVELALESEQFEALWPLTQGRRVEKVRHRLEHEGHSLEVDVYGGELEGLVVAEVEFESEATASRFEGPVWLGREVTGDARYSNRALAERGAPA